MYGICAHMVCMVCMANMVEFAPRCDRMTAGPLLLKQHVFYGSGDLSPVQTVETEPRRVVPAL